MFDDFPVKERFKTGDRVEAECSINLIVLSDFLYSSITFFNRGKLRRLKNDGDNTDYVVCEIVIHDCNVQNTQMQALRGLEFHILQKCIILKVQPKESE